MKLQLKWLHKHGIPIVLWDCVTFPLTRRGTSAAGPSSDSVASSSSKGSISATPFFDCEFDLFILADLLVLQGGLEGCIHHTYCQEDLRLCGIGASLESAYMPDITFAMWFKTWFKIYGNLATPYYTSFTRLSRKFATNIIISSTEDGSWLGICSTTNLRCS